MLDAEFSTTKIVATRAADIDFSNHSPYYEGITRMHIIANIRGFRIPVFLSTDHSLWIMVDDAIQAREARYGRHWPLGQHVLDTSEFGGDEGWITTFVPASVERERFIELLATKQKVIRQA